MSNAITYYLIPRPNDQGAISLAETLVFDSLEAVITAYREQVLQAPGHPGQPSRMHVYSRIGPFGPLVYQSMSCDFLPLEFSTNYRKYTAVATGVYGSGHRTFVSYFLDYAFNRYMDMGRRALLNGGQVVLYSCSESTTALRESFLDYNASDLPNLPAIT